MASKYSATKRFRQWHVFAKCPSYLLIILLLSVLSCRTPTRHWEPQRDSTTFHKDSMPTIGAVKSPIESQASSSGSDTLTIDKACAVFYQPDSLQMEMRMKQVGQDEFRQGADDYIYYINTSAEYLESKGLPVIDAKNKRYLKFVSRNGQVQVIKSDTLAELWGMYLFDPKKKTYAADITMIDEEYENYYR